MNNDVPIVLGDEIEDITCKVRGVCIGKSEYLDGTKTYYIQPPYDDNGNRVNLVEVQEPYAKRVGDGVRVEAKKPIGFTLERKV